MRLMLLAIAALLASWGSVAAQVAAPFLNPTPTFNGDPGNPAVLSWDMPSRVGASASTAKFEDPTGATQAKGNLLAGQAQYAGQTVALGASVAKLAADIEPSFGGGALTQTFTRLQAAVALGQWASVGIGQDGDKRVDPGGTEKHRTNHAGVTLRIAELIYLGAVSGTDTVAKGTAPPFLEARRNVTRAGAGVHWVGKSGAFHLEGFRETDASEVTPSVSVNELRTTGGTLEVRIARLGIGFTTNSTIEINASTGTQVRDQRFGSASIAYIPEHGLALSLTSSSFRSNGGGPPKGAFTTVGASYLF